MGGFAGVTQKPHNKRFKMSMWGSFLKAEIVSTAANMKAVL